MSNNKSYIVRLLIVFGIVWVLNIGFSITQKLFTNNKKGESVNESQNTDIERSLSILSKFPSYEIYEYMKLYDAEKYVKVVDELTTKANGTQNLDDSIFDEAKRMAKDLEYEYFFQAPDWAIYKYLKQYVKFLEFAKGVHPIYVFMIENPLVFNDSIDEIHHEYAYCRMDDALKELIVSSLGSPSKFDVGNVEKSYFKFMKSFEEKYQLESDYLSSVPIKSDSLAFSKLADLNIKLYTELLNQEVSEISNIYKYKRYLTKK